MVAIIKVDHILNNNMVVGVVIIQIKIRIETTIMAITTTTCNVVIVEEGEEGAIIVATIVTTTTTTTIKAINGNSLDVVAGAVVLNNITTRTVKKVAVRVMVVMLLVASRLKIMVKGSRHRFSKHFCPL